MSNLIPNISINMGPSVRPMVPSIPGYSAQQSVNVSSFQQGSIGQPFPSANIKQVVGHSGLPSNTRQGNYGIPSTNQQSINNNPQFSVGNVSSRPSIVMPIVSNVQNPNIPSIVNLPTVSGIPKTIIPSTPNIPRPIVQPVNLPKPQSNIPLQVQARPTGSYQQVPKVPSPIIKAVPPSVILPGQVQNITKGIKQVGQLTPPPKIEKQNIKTVKSNKTPREIANRNTSISLGFKSFRNAGPQANTVRANSKVPIYEDPSIIDPINYILTPATCTCGKIIDDDPIIEELENGKTFIEAIATTDIIKNCCIRTVQTSPHIVNLQKEVKLRMAKKALLEGAFDRSENRIIPITTRPFSDAIYPQKMVNDDIRTILSGPTNLEVIFGPDGFLVEKGQGYTDIVCDKQQISESEARLLYERERERERQLRELPILERVAQSAYDINAIEGQQAEGTVEPEL